MAFRRFTDVSLMMRSEVGVTRCDEPVVESVRVREPSRLAFTIFSERLLADTAVFGRFLISGPFIPDETGFDTDHIKPQVDIQYHPTGPAVDAA